MTELNLSKRLRKIASYVPKGAYFADIGTDHAYLSCFICLNDDQAVGIASDVNEGPLLAARKTIQKYNLDHRIDTRLGDGLETIKDEEISLVIIAGMGGSLIKEILDRGKETLYSVNRLILQPNVGEAPLRKWLIQNDYLITSEELIEENGKFYEVIVADQAKERDIFLSEKEIYFGPHLIRENSAIFKKKWLERKGKLTQIIKQMETSEKVSKVKLAEFKRQLKWIEEVLKK